MASPSAPRSSACSAVSRSSLAAGLLLTTAAFASACSDPVDPAMGAFATMGTSGSGGAGTAGTTTAMGGTTVTTAGGGTTAMGGTTVGIPSAGMGGAAPAGMAGMAGMAAVGAAGAMNAGTPVSFAAELEHFFEENCVEGCHITGSFGGPNGQSADANLSLVPGESYAALVGVPSTQVPTMALVGPTAAESYLWHKLNGTQADVGGMGLQMPFGAAIRDPASLDLIFAWIEGGAQP